MDWVIAYAASHNAAIIDLTTYDLRKRAAMAEVGDLLAQAE